MQSFRFQVCLTEMMSSAAMKEQVMTRKKTVQEVVQQSEFADMFTVPWYQSRAHCCFYAAQSAVQTKVDEDDIEVGSARMSLKCPVSLAELSTLPDLVLLSSARYSYRILEYLTRCDQTCVRTSNVVTWTRG
jgi:hypothetical protein